MKVIVNENEVEETLYPKLKQHKDGNIVLFTENNCGTLVKDCPPLEYGVGFYSNQWRENEFTLFTRSITLSNE